MKLSVKTINDVVKGSLELSDAVYGVPYRQDIIARMVTWQLSKRQAGTHQTKTISMISGTTRKPFRQKGTGNARQGSLRSPQFRGGATIFGPQSRSHAHKLTRKFRKLALKTALSEKLRADSLCVFDNFDLSSLKTADFAKSFASYLHLKTLLIDVKEKVGLLRQAGSNLPNIDVLPVEGVNVYDLVRHKHVLISKEAAKQLEEKLDG
ncbi:MAG: 50S ribosomal protein L4 [Alphaproteobacteria bacterium]|nr:MAG: 50S ribosomal protein L4 [Alphaproteobacteria bacterium]